MKVFLKKLRPSGKSCEKKFLLIESRKNYHKYNIAKLFVKTKSKSDKNFFFYYLSKLFI